MRSGMFESRPGWTRCEVTIERPTKTQDATYGTDVVTWVPLAYAAGSPAVALRMPAEVQDTKPSRDEALRQGIVVGRQQTVLQMHYRPDITGDMRVTVHRDSAVTYRIIGGPVEVGGRKQDIEMLLERTTT